jgi:hypothetical protein
MSPSNGRPVSREAFIKRWAYHLTGMALYGLVASTRHSTLEQATRAHEIPAEVERLLGRMYDELHAPPVSTPAQPARKT